MFLFPIFLITLVNFCASTRSAPDCPHIEVIKNFNVSQFTGLWHEYARNDGMDTSEIDCATINYIQTDSDYIRIMSSFYYQEDAKMILDRKMKISKTSAIFEANYRSEIQINQYIVDTDYKSYALTVWCIKHNSQMIPTTYVSILSRSPVLDPEVSKKLFKTMQLIGHGTSSVILVNQIGCLR